MKTRADAGTTATRQTIRHLPREWFNARMDALRAARTAR